MAQQHVHVGERAAHHDGVAGCAAVPKGDLHRRFGGAVHVDEAHRRRQTLQRQPSHRERQRLATAEHIAQLALQRRQQDRQGRRRLKELPKDRRHKLRRGHALAHQRVREQRRRQHDVVGGHHHGGATGPRPEELECGHIKEQPRAPQHAVGRRERKLDARLVNVVGVAAVPEVDALGLARRARREQHRASVRRGGWAGLKRRQHLLPRRNARGAAADPVQRRRKLRQGDFRHRCHQRRRRRRRRHGRRRRQHELDGGQDGHVVLALVGQ